VKSYSQKIEVHSFGDSYADATHILEDPILEPGPGELRIRNHFAGVNGLFDHTVMQSKVAYLKLQTPFDLGVESVGVVEAVGEVIKADSKRAASLKVGDGIATSGLGGAYRHRQIVAQDNVYQIPAITPEYLAIVPTGVSALVALERVAELKSGETLVVSAAAGGLGHIWIQLACNLDCRVIGIAGSDEKCDFVLGLGAERCINYKSEDVSQVLAEEYNDHIDVAVDTVGGVIFDALLDNLAPLGRLLVSGYAAEMLEGAQPVLMPRVYEKLYWKGASIRGYMNALLAHLHRDAALRLFSMMQDGSLKVSIDSTKFLGLESIPVAAEHMMSGRNIGKTVVDLR